MTTSPHLPIREDDLHAFVDGALTPERRAAVEAYLAATPEAARDVADWQAQRDGIKAMFAPGTTRPVVRRTAFNGVRPLWAGGAAVAMLVVGLVSGFLIAPLVDVEGNGTAASLGDWAQTNFLVYASDVKHPVEVGKDEKAHLLQWLGKRLGEPVHAPDLGAQGFELIGGRLVTYDGKPAALLMYEDKSGERLTLALGRNSGNAETGFLQTEHDGVRTFHWIDGPVGYGVSGRLDSYRLKVIATLVYEQL
jgi:anti-sigma factor RsiW